MEISNQELKELIASLALRQAKFDQQLAASQAEADRRQAEVDRRQAEADARQVEVDRRRQAEADARQAEADKRQAEADKRQAEADARQAEADKRKVALDAQMALTDAKLKKLGELYGNVSQNLGAAAEEFFFNSLLAEPVIGKVRYDQIHAHVYGGKMGHQQEYDLVLTNGNSAAIVEVKHKVHPRDVEQVQQQLRLYREHFPEYKGFALYGGVAGMSIPDDVVKVAHEKGLFVLKCKGNVLETDTAAMRAF